MTSTTCGHFCIFYAYMKAMGLSLSDIMNMFSIDLEKNSDIVVDFYRKIM
jgi:antitoxin component of RelBE/YafQ-DinJ toxin-antitoxin module